MDHCAIYVTFPNNEEARTIARFLLEKRVVACVNIFPQVQSLYIWNDELQDDTETVIIAKTTLGQSEHIIELIKKNHSYDCPCITVFPFTHGNPDFLNWISSQTR